MKEATLTAAGALGDFLKTTRPLELSFELHPSVKDVVESQGIPHTAVHKLFINGTEQDFNYNLRDGDQIIAYPFTHPDSTDVDPIFISPVRFITDVHLGKLTKTMRLLGLDTRSGNNWDDLEIIHQSNKEKCMILTRDLELLKHGNTRYGYWIRATNPDEQINELFDRFALANQVQPFTRCMKCNGLLTETELKEIKGQVPPKVQQWHSKFWTCTKCNQVYWKGSHYKQLQQKVAELTDR